MTLTAPRWFLTEHDDLADAISDIGSAGGTLQLPAGTVTLASTLTISNPNLRIVGAANNATTINYTGSGTAIDVTAAARVHLSDFRLTTSTGQHGVVFGYTGAVTGFRYGATRLDIDGFSGRGLAALNCEHLLAEQVIAQNCGTGIYADNSLHSGSALGLNNVWRQCRAQDCTGDGWDVNDQQGAIFDACQALSNTATNAQFFLRGNTFACSVRGLDVENDTQATVGAKIAGQQNTVSVTSFRLATGVLVSFATGCRVEPSRFASVTTPISVDANSSKTVVFPAGSTVSDSGTGTTLVGT